MYYTKKKSRRAKKIRININSRGEVFLIVPQRIPYFIAENFIKEKTEWIYKNIKKQKKKEKKNVLFTSKEEYSEHKEEAEKKIIEKIEHFNSFYNFKYNKIYIKRQKTLWGSCSKNKNLNFNYKIIFLPKNLFEYIIVHELCHLKELNHSKNFHNLIENMIPQHKTLERELKKYSLCD